MAIKVSELRLERNKNLFSEPFIVQLHKYDFDFLRNSDAFQFESFIVEQFGGIPNVKQRGDSGIDGKTRDGLAIQVKRSDNIGRNVVDNFLSAINRFDKKLFETQKTNKSEVGYIIAFSFGKGAIGEVARLKHEENINIKLVRVDEIVPMATKPKLNLIISEKNIGEIDSKGNREFILKAKAESESGIEFFAWNFNYDENLGFQAEIMIDKTGEQNYKFGIGEHKIAVKAIDNDGLESIEIVKLKINGKIEIISTSK